MLLSALTFFFLNDLSSFRGNPIILAKLICCLQVLNRLTLYKNHKFLDSSKPKEFADDEFKFDENDRKFSKRVENTVGNGEIACHAQFLLSTQCFQKTRTEHTLKPVLAWERVKPSLKFVYLVKI